MTTQYMRKPNGSLIATIRTGAEGVLWLHKPNGTCLGSYRPHNNGTFLPNGSFVGWGNLLGTLVCDR